MPVLTHEERNELDKWADSEGHAREGYQVYDETEATDDDDHVDAPIGPLHSTPEAAERWGRENAPESGKWTVFHMARAVTRTRKVWYLELGSPLYTSF